MSLFRATIKRKVICNGVHLDAGMSVEVLTNSIQTTEGKNKIAEAFMKKYDVDVKKTGTFTQYMDIVKIS